MEVLADPSIKIKRMNLNWPRLGGNSSDASEAMPVIHVELGTLAAGEIREWVLGVYSNRSPARVRGE